MNELALFAGAGGGILGGKLLGWRTVCAVERDAYAAQVLAQRQNDGMLDPFPIWSDVCSFDGRPWRGLVDIVSGGFPCQDISAAGKGAGIDGQRSGLWSEFARIIGEVRPRFVFVENSPMLVGRGLGRVLGDLASLGFDAEWGVLGADDAGAPHRRERIWILGHARSERRQQSRDDHASHDGSQLGPTGKHSGEMAHANRKRELQPEGLEPASRGRIGNGGAQVAHPLGDRWQERRPELPRIEGRPSAFGGSPSIPHAMREGLPQPEQASLLRAGGGQERRTTRELHRAFPNPSRRLQERWRGRVGRWLRSQEGHGGTLRRGGSQGAGLWWATEPALGRVAHGVAHRVDRLKAIGNGQVPAVAALAFQTLYSRLIG